MLKLKEMQEMVRDCEKTSFMVTTVTHFQQRAMPANHVVKVCNCKFSDTNIFPHQQ